MRWFRSTLEGAGLAQHGTAVITASMILSCVGLGALAVFATSIFAFGIFIALGLAALELETLASVARKRRKNLTKLWPEVVDSINSAVSSGLNLIDAFEDLGRSGPLRLRRDFRQLTARIDGGWPMGEALTALKSQFGEVHCDRLCELLSVVSITGSDSLARTLRNQSIQLRRDITTSAEIDSKQGWITGTAKLAVAAPWAVVAMLSSRPESASIYNSPSGVAILLIGFLVSIFAYRLVHIFGALPEQPRVFA